MEEGESEEGNTAARVEGEGGHGLVEWPGFVVLVKSNFKWGAWIVWLS